MLDNHDKPEVLDELARLEEDVKDEDNTPVPAWAKGLAEKRRDEWMKRNGKE